MKFTRFTRFLPSYISCRKCWWEKTFTSAQQSTSKSPRELQGCSFHELSPMLGWVSSATQLSFSQPCTYKSIHRSTQLVLGRIFSLVCWGWPYLSWIDFCSYLPRKSHITAFFLLLASILSVHVTCTSVSASYQAENHLPAKITGAE